ncbi:hypothetical protein PHYBLDRAFT_119153, partial [Phycomyces blakesleeanus NRRL 1555(-)]
ESMREEIFQLLHCVPTAGHLGLHRTLQWFQRLFWFEGFRTWVTQKVLRCLVCQESKSPRHTLGHTEAILQDPTLAPFDIIAIDAFGPLPLSAQDHKYILVVQCLFS